MKPILFKTFRETAESMSGLNKEMVQKITGLDLIFIDRKDTLGNVCFANSPEVRLEFKESCTHLDLVNYFYAVLHSSSYKEFNQNGLDIDLSQAYITNDKLKFWKFVQLGSELHKIHFSKNDIENDSISFPKDGDNNIKEIKFEIPVHTVTVCNSPSEEGNYSNPNLGRVYINENQYFNNISEEVWNFYIDNYQPAKKWLLDRNDLTLTKEDILYYRQMIVMLTETVRIIKEINTIKI